MKKSILLLLGLFFVAFSFGQSNAEEIDLYQSMYGLEKKAIVKEFVVPKDVNKAAFWKLYDEYEVNRKVLGKERVMLLDEFAKKYLTMTNEESEAWMKKVIALDDNQDKLIVKYYNKVKKANSPILAMRFYQLEVYLLTSIRLEILDAIPFVEEK